jgi:hypothetical protein
LKLLDIRFRALFFLLLALIVDLQSGVLFSQAIQS